MADPTLSDRLRARWQAHIGAPWERQVRAPLRRLGNAGREYRPVFVTGASGSGTSFLAVSLGQRFDCAGVVYESDAQIGRRSFLRVPALARFASVAEYLDFIATREDWGVEQGRRDLLDMFRSYALRPSPVMIAKGPDIHLVRAAYLHRCFPDARFVAVHRDPVANVEGLRRKWPVFGRDTLGEVIRFYREIHERFLDATAELPGKCILVSYERLVESTEETFEALGERLGLERSRSPMQLSDSRDSEGKGLRNVRKNRIEVVRDANQRARQRLSPEETRAIEDELGPLQERMLRSTSAL